MADLVNKFHVQDAIDDLEKNYPEAFNDLSRPLSKDVPADYPAFVIIRKFLAQIEINDRYFDEQERRLGRVKSGIMHYQTVSEIARKAHLSSRIIKEYLQDNPNLNLLYIRKQKERDMVVLTNARTGEQKIFNTPREAAKFIHVKIGFFKKYFKLHGKSRTINGWRPARFVKGEARHWNG